MGKAVGKIAAAMHRRPQRPQRNVGVHMLVSSKTWQAGLVAAVSFEHHTERQWTFYIHEDGTIREEERREIRKILPDVRLVPREESDAKADVLLASHPHCLSHRSRHNLFLKVADFVAFTPGDRFIVLDSDVVFFARPSEMRDRIDSDLSVCRYNEDSKEKYCVPRNVVEADERFLLPRRFNSGLMLLPRDALDFALAERFVSKFESVANHPQFFEQTLYALMAGARGESSALPATYDISWNYFRKQGAVCRHYIGDFKNDLFWIEGAPLLLASLLQRRFSKTV